MSNGCLGAVSIDIVSHLVVELFPSRMVMVGAIVRLTAICFAFQALGVLSSY
jgi:hypothetical protein